MDSGNKGVYEVDDDVLRRQRGLTVATKVYPSTPGIHKSDVLTEQFNTSLKELGADCVDIFYLHAAVGIFHVYESN